MYEYNTSCSKFRDIFLGDSLRIEVLSTFVGSWNGYGAIEYFFLHPAWSQALGIEKRDQSFFSSAKKNVGVNVWEIAKSA